MLNYSNLTKFKILPCRKCNCENCTKEMPETKFGEIEKLQNLKLNLESKPVLGYESKGVFKQASPLNENSNKSSPLSIAKFFKLPSLNMPKLNFAPNNASSILFDVVGTVSFFIMMSIMFWIAVSQCLWSFAKKLLQTDKNVQLIALALFLLLCASITFHALKGTHNGKHSTPVLKTAADSVQMSNTVKETSKNLQQKRYCNHKNCLHSRKSNGNIETVTKKTPKSCQLRSKPSNGNMETGKNPSLCELCAKKFKPENNLQPSLSDEEIREMFKRYKLYSVASDMKFPPSFGHVFEVISGFFEG